MFDAFVIGENFLHTNPLSDAWDMLRVGVWGFDGTKFET